MPVVACAWHRSNIIAVCTGAPDVRVNAYNLKQLTVPGTETDGRHTRWADAPLHDAVSGVHYSINHKSGPLADLDRPRWRPRWSVVRQFL